MKSNVVVSDGIIMRVKQMNLNRNGVKIDDKCL
jgi:hypothetical protein